MFREFTDGEAYIIAKPQVARRKFRYSPTCPAHEPVVISSGIIPFRAHNGTIFLLQSAWRNVQQIGARRERERKGEEKDGTYARVIVRRSYK